MHDTFENLITMAVSEFCAKDTLENIWRRPIVRFAGANDPGFARLREIVTSEHHLPMDFLPEAKTVISYFLPFKREIPDGNLTGADASPQWAKAYLDTNRMSLFINERICDYLRLMGHAAASPADAGMISMENPRSRWSQRHVAYLAGHGTFGINNMLISDSGSAGRYFSVITAMPMRPDGIITEERCLRKKCGACGVCIQRCPENALSEAGFDRFRCLERCLKNEARYPGADVCGKCAVALPCSYRVPE